MNGIKCRSITALRPGSTNRALLLVFAAVLGGVAIAVVVAVRAAAPVSDISPSGTVSPTNPLRPGVNSPGGSPSKPSPEPAVSNSATPTQPGAVPPSVRPEPSGEKAVANLPPAAPAGKHPLDAAIAMAEKVLDHLRKDVKDYSCIIVKQERLDGKLGDPEFMAAKIRQQPLSVYLKFIKPDDARGREVIYVAGANDGKLSVRDGSGWTRSLGVLSLPPTGPVAMHGNRYPITNLGLMHLTERLLEVARQERRYGEIEVHFFKDAKVNGRPCTLIEVIHPVERRNFIFHEAQIYIDDELHVPIRYVAYMWPKPGDDPPVDESYTYLNLKLNVGLTGADFDPHNPSYHFYDK